MVELTMWGGFYNKEGQQLQEICNSRTFPILTIKAGRISDFGGKSLGTITIIQLLINPQLLESKQLRTWFDIEGNNLNSHFITKKTSYSMQTRIVKSIVEIEDDEQGKFDKLYWTIIKAT